MRIVDRIINADKQERLRLYQQMTDDERKLLSLMLDAEISNPYARYQTDPVGFITDGLQETIWSKQREIAQSVVNNQRTVVPACHGLGKSHLSARLVAWWVSSYPLGTSLAITIAPTHRQVRNIIWSQIRQVHARTGLSGQALTTTWKVEEQIVAYGFSPNPYDESALQGIHAPNLLIVVDEAGGIGEVIGNSIEALMTGGNTRLLLIGNPPTDKEDSWFERCCSNPLYNVIPVPTSATPNFTGETVGACKACPPFVEKHDVNKHLVDQRWVDDVVQEFGEDSNFVEARVHARFPRQTANKVIPFAWLEQAQSNENPLQSDIVKLGVDIASDGGDEFAIAEQDGYTIRLVHRSSGTANANAVDVASVIVEHIRTAVDKHKQRQIRDKVRVKIDTIGLGWGVVSLLQRWAQEGKFDAHIIPVNVSERASDSNKFRNQRAEMWWNGRTLIQKNDDGIQVKLDVDRQTLAQLANPFYRSDSAGRIQIEGKAEMKRRGVSSPDRGEAILLAMYEPRGSFRQAVPPISIGQANQWLEINNF